MGDRLLVIDGDPVLREAYVSHFTRAGFDVHCAATVAEGASLLDQHGFDALIADVREAADGAGSAPAGLDTGRVPVVVLTAYGEPHWATEAARRNVDAFLHKPVSLLWLEQLVRSRIDETRLSSARPAAG